jgi:hypothetical protein
MMREADQELLGTHYESDDEQLKSVPGTEVTYIETPAITSQTEIIDICGFPSKERRVFTFLLAQYLSLKGKVLFFESDFEYLELSDMVSRSGVQATVIHLDELFRHAEQTLLRIKSSTSKLIFLGGTSRTSYSYNFLLNLLFVHLNGHINYLVTERNIEDLSENQNHIIVFPDTIVDLIKTLDSMKVSVKPSTRFVALDMLALPELTSFSQEALGLIIRDITQQNVVNEVLVFKIQSLMLGGEVHDLQMLFRTE